MTALPRSTLLGYLRQRGLDGLDEGFIVDLLDSIVLSGEAGATLSTTNIDAGASGTAGSIDIFPATAWRAMSIAADGTITEVEAAAAA